MDETTQQISIVDDDASVRRALERLCRSAGYVVASHESAEAYLEDTSANHTDCLILDVHLPERSGLQLQKDLHDAGNQVPIVFVTAFEDEQSRRQALETGAAEFLQKPLDNERLLEVIQLVLGHSV